MVDRWVDWLNWKKDNYGVRLHSFLQSNSQKSFTERKKETRRPGTSRNWWMTETGTCCPVCLSACWRSRECLLLAIMIITWDWDSYLFPLVLSLSSLVIVIRAYGGLRTVQWLGYSHTWTGRIGWTRQPRHNNTPPETSKPVCGISCCLAWQPESSSLLTAWQVAVEWTVMWDGTIGWRKDSCDE